MRENRKRLLFITSHIRKERENWHVLILRALESAYDISLLLIHTIFIDEEILQNIKSLGIEIISIRKAENLGIKEKKMNEIFAVPYDLILFDNYYTAKYYLPYLAIYAPAASYVLFSKKSRLLSLFGLSKREMKTSLKENLGSQIESAMDLEVPVYHYMDLVIMEKRTGVEEIVSEVPGTPMEFLPVYKEGENEKDLSREFADIFSRAIVKRKREVHGTVEISVMEGKVSRGEWEEYHDYRETDEELRLKTTFFEREKDRSLIAGFNRMLNKCRADQLFVSLSDYLIPPGTIQNLQFCLETHPKLALVFPSTNEETVAPSSHSDVKNFQIFLKKHFAGNFAQWDEAKAVRNLCFLVKRTVFDRVGELDERLENTGMALMDFSYRLFQAGHRMKLMKESFAYNTYYAKQSVKEKEEKIPEKSEERDKLLLMEKWGKNGSLFLESVDDDASPAGTHP